MFCCFEEKSVVRTNWRY